jgi:hypothetical protein
MRSVDPFPTDWKQRVEECIRNRDYPFLPQTKQQERREKEMLRLLSKDEVEAAADILWKAARNRPEIQGNFTRIIFESLFDLGRVLLFVPPSLTRRFYREGIKFLEYVRGNSRRFRRGEARIALERAILDYRLDEIDSPMTRPKEPGPRIAQVALQDRFKRIYGKTLDSATAHFLRAAYPTTNWTGAEVGARRREISRKR